MRPLTYPSHGPNGRLCCSQVMQSRPVVDGATALEYYLRK
jgi:hypothetical protein